MARVLKRELLAKKRKKVNARYQRLLEVIDPELNVLPEYPVKNENGRVDVFKLINLAKYVLLHEEFPMIEDIIIKGDIQLETLAKFRKENEELEMICQKIKARQTVHLIKGVITGNTNVIGSIFIMKALLGIRDNEKDDKTQPITVNTINYNTDKALTMKEARAIADKITPEAIKEIKQEKKRRGRPPKTKVVKDGDTIGYNQQEGEGESSDA